MKHYKTTEQITEQCEYEFNLPKYGQSTTDPTYYEPSATRIANMRKSASAGKSLYDFTGEDLPKDKYGNIDWSKQDISKTRIVPGRKPGLTREEISQNLTDIQADVDSMKADKEAEKIAKEQQIQDVKNTLKSIDSDDGNSANKSE